MVKKGKNLRQMRVNDEYHDGPMSGLKDQEKLNRYEQLISFGQLVSSSLDYKSIQKKAVNKIKKLIQCEHVIIYRVDSKNNELYYRGIDGSREGFREIRLKIDEYTFAGACAHYVATFHEIKKSTDLRFKKIAIDINEERAVKEILSTPLVAKGEVLGVIQAINSLNKCFNNDDIHFIEAISNQLSVAIENSYLFEKYNNQFIQICEALSNAVIIKDQYTGGHIKRVVIFSEMIAREMDLSFKEFNDLKLAAVLHDIGKIGIADKILKKQSKLSEDEFKKMCDHPKYGHEILGHIENLDTVVDAIRYHHERTDGAGYPYGLQGDDIPLLAQIISVADTFDAMISHRPYRKGMPPMVAYKEILNCSGSQFSIRVVNAFEKAFKKSHMYKKELDNIKMTG